MGTSTFIEQKRILFDVGRDFAMVTCNFQEGTCK
jgi:hypothetical protein